MKTSLSKTSFFQNATATRNPKLVMPYKIKGIHGFIRLDIRSPRGRTYVGVWPRARWLGISRGEGARRNGEGNGEGAASGELL